MISLEHSLERAQPFSATTVRVVAHHTRDPLSSAALSTQAPFVCPVCGSMSLRFLVCSCSPRWFFLSLVQACAGHLAQGLRALAWHSFVLGTYGVAHEHLLAASPRPPSRSPAVRRQVFWLSVSRRTWSTARPLPPGSAIRSGPLASAVCSAASFRERSRLSRDPEATELNQKHASAGRRKVSLKTHSSMSQPAPSPSAVVQAKASLLDTLPATSADSSEDLAMDVTEWRDSVSVGKETVENPAVVSVGSEMDVTAVAVSVGMDVVRSGVEEETVVAHPRLSSLLFFPRALSVIRCWRLLEVLPYRRVSLFLRQGQNLRSFLPRKSADCSRLLRKLDLGRVLAHPPRNSEDRWTQGSLRSVLLRPNAYFLTGANKSSSDRPRGGHTGQPKDQHEDCRHVTKALGLAEWWITMR